MKGLGSKQNPREFSRVASDRVCGRESERKERNREKDKYITKGEELKPKI